jgi:hypothetical protein
MKNENVYSITYDAKQKMWIHWKSLHEVVKILNGRIVLDSDLDLFRFPCKDDNGSLRFISLREGRELIK